MTSLSHTSRSHPSSHMPLKQNRFVAFIYPPFSDPKAWVHIWIFEIDSFEPWTDVHIVIGCSTNSLACCLLGRPGNSREASTSSFTPTPRFQNFFRMLIPFAQISIFDRAPSFPPPFYQFAICLFCSLSLLGHRVKLKVPNSLEKLSERTRVSFNCVD